MLGGPGVYAGRQSLHLPFWALRPKPRPTFSRRESRQRYARDLLIPGPPAQGGGPPWIPPPSALAVLVEGIQGLRHPRGAARQSGLPIAFPLSSKKTAASPVDCTGRTWQRGPIRGQELFPDEGDGNREWEQGNKHLFLLYIHFYIYLL